MKLHWKVALVMLIGLLVAGQVVSLQYARAASERMERAASELRDAKKEQAEEEARLNAILAKWKKMNAMSMSSMDRRILDLARDVVTNRVESLEGVESVIGAIENIWGEVGRNR